MSKFEHELQDGRIANIEVRLQGTGICLGIAANQLKVGDKMVWNNGGTSTVESIEFSKTGKTMNVVESYFDTFKKEVKLYTRKFANVEHRGVVVKDLSGNVAIIY